MCTQRHILVSRYINCYNPKEIKLIVKELSDVDDFTEQFLKKISNTGKYNFIHILIAAYFKLKNTYICIYLYIFLCTPK